MSSVVIALFMSRSSRTAAIYLVATIVNVAVPYLLLPVLTRYLSPAGYGQIAMFQTVSSIAAAVSLFGLSGPLLRTFTVETRSVQADYLATCLAISGVASFIAILVTVVLSTSLMGTTHLSLSWMLAAALSGIAATVLQMKLTVFRAENRAVSYGIAAGVQTIFNACISLVLVIGLREGWQGRAMGIFISALLLAFWSMFSFRRQGLIGIIRRRYATEALSLGAAASVHTILGVLMANGDRLFLSAYYPAHVLGIYTVASQLGSAYGIFGSALNLAWAPWLSAA